jgi:hypothetical protein
VVVDSGILVTPIADIILSLMLTLLVRNLRPWFDSEYFFGAISGCFSQATRLPVFNETGSFCARDSSLIRRGTQAVELTGCETFVWLAALLPELLVPSGNPDVRECNPP